VRGIFGYLAGMLRKSISGFVEPCRPSKATRPPSGPEWVHEIKHDGFRLMVRREGARVRCFHAGRVRFGPIDSLLSSRPPAASRRDRS
jgi:hypothetical protein